MSSICEAFAGKLKTIFSKVTLTGRLGGVKTPTNHKKAIDSVKLSGSRIVKNLKALRNSKINGEKSKNSEYGHS